MFLSYVVASLLSYPPVGYYVELGVLVHDLLPIHVLVTLLSAYVWSLRLEQRG